MNSLYSRKEAFIGVLLFFVFIFRLPAQNKEANNWYWGVKAGLTFNTTPPSKLLDSNMGLGIWSAASISDSVGKLLFYTIGDMTWGADHQIMPNGNGISFDSVYGFYASSIIIPWTGHTGKYWVFYCGRPPDIPTLNQAEWYNHAICGYVVNMNLNHGLGDVDTSYKIRLYRYAEALITCMLHSNGKDNWLIGRRFNTDTLLAWKIDSMGLNNTPIKSRVFSSERKHITSSGTIYFDDGLKGIKASPNSEMLYWGWEDYRLRKNLLLKFNRLAGKFSSLISLVDSVGLDSMSSEVWQDGTFSPDNRYIYTSEYMYWKPKGSIPNSQNKRLSILRQYSLDVWDSTVIKNSAKQIYKTPLYPVQGATIGPMSGQLGPDGKIYIQQTGSPKLSVLNCPSSPSDKVKFEYQKIDIQRNGGFRLPTLNQTFVRNADIFQLQANKRSICQGDTLELSGYGAGAEHFTWSVSPALPASLKVDTLTWQKFSTKEIAAGSYTFSCKATNRCGDVFEKSMVVTINPNPSPTLTLPEGKGTPCTGDSVILKVQNSQTDYRYFWSTGQVSDTIVVKQSGKYSLDSVVTNKGCGVKQADTITVNIKNAVVPPVPVLATPLEIQICSGTKAQLSIVNSPLSIQTRWSNGAVGDSITVQSGKFTVQSETLEGCTSAWSDTVRVVEFGYPKPRFVNVDSVLDLHKLISQNYCVSGFPGSRFSFSVLNGSMVDSSEDCVTVNWQPGNVSRSITVVETRKEAGCEGPAKQVIRYSPGIGVPNLITPNGDGHNDLFVIEDLEFYSNHRLQIFNRWGKKVLDSSAYKQDWNEEQGIYFYRLVVDGKEINGWILVEK